MTDNIDQINNGHFGAFVKYRSIWYHIQPKWKIIFYTLNDDHFGRKYNGHFGNHPH